MVTEEEETEAEIQKKDSNNNQLMLNPSERHDESIAVNEDLTIPLEEEKVFDDLMEERVNLEEDEEEENWGDEDDEQYMEELLNNEDLLGYDLFQEDEHVSMLIPVKPIPVTSISVDEKEDSEQPEEEFPNKTLNLANQTISTKEAIEGISPELQLVINSPVSTRKKFQQQTPLIGFGVKNKLFQIRSSPKRKNKGKKIGPIKTKTSPITKAQFGDPLSSPGPSRVSGPHTGEETPNLPP